MMMHRIILLANEWFVDRACRSKQIIVIDIVSTFKWWLVA